jgi:hypothetical protein
VPDAPTSETQATAEPAVTTASPAPDSAPKASEAKPVLASLADAVRAVSQPERASKREQAPSSAGSDTEGTPSKDVTPSQSQPSPGAASDQPKPEDEGTPAEAVTPETDARSSDREQGKEPPPSRRERAEIRDLTTERDTLKAELDHLRQAVAIPESVQQAAIKDRLSDEDFGALEEKLKRQDITGDYLTVDEQAAYNKAYQIRQWSLPWYSHAQQQAATWVQGKVTEVQQAQANDLAPLLKDRPYLSPDVIGRADSWRTIYDHIAEASLAEGKRQAATELQPKLDKALGDISDLEAELSGRRPAGGRTVRTFERGGMSGGAYVARPDYKSARSTDLFAAAIEEDATRRTRRAG